MTLATIILAAGRSSRLGQPKQLLQLDGIPLVRRMAELALSLAAGPVVVVTGANADAIGDALANVPVQLIFNAAYETGMASSVQAGLTYLSNPALSGQAVPDPETDAYLILLTDQPHVDLPLLQTIWQTAQTTEKGIVASQYGDTLGVPVLFKAHYVPNLLALTGDSGARKLVQQHLTDCEAVPFPNGAIDLDTPEDVERWQRRIPLS